MKLLKCLLICIWVIAFTIRVIGAPENIEKTADGVLIHLGTAQVELATANNNTFRLSVSFDGPPQAVASTFLANSGSDNSVPWQVVKHHGMIGIRTTFGELLMNPKNGKWALKNANGKTLIPALGIGDFSWQTEDPSIALALGWKKEKPIYVYGCGNGVNSLQQSKTTTGLANGIAVIPYYWVDIGYSVLAVTADDNYPAHWLAGTNGASITWIFPGKKADLYLTPAATLKEAAKDYAHLTGYAPVPPRWALGYLQSRWGWANRAYIEDTLAKFLDLKLPVDAFIFDFEWYTPKPDYTLPPSGLLDYHDFNWNPNLFPDPSEQIASYKEEGVHSVFIRKPRMGNAGTLAMIRKNHWDLASGMRKYNFESRDVNFANPDFREWYISQCAGLLKDGVDGWWDDEGEAAYTLYYYWNLTEKEALERYRPGKRLWTLNRAFSPGLQKFGAAAWTGDIKSSWAVLSATPTALLNWTLAGMPYETCDIGGYYGKPSPVLLSRWMEAGVFFPVMRSHSERTELPRFPWLRGPDALNAIRKALDLRYRLIPFYYSLAHETSETGLPLMRPVLMEFPDDPKAANLSDEWLMGDSLLAAPVMEPGDKRAVYLPKDTWYSFESNATLKGGQTLEVSAKLDEIPVYVRAGTILPLGPVIQHTSQLPGGPLQLEIYPGKDATFTLVEDDGETTNYLNGKMRRTIFNWNDATGQLTWTTTGNYAGEDVFKSFHAEVFDPRGVIQGEGRLGSNGSLTLKE
jgi:alpha-glucosidase